MSSLTSLFEKLIFALDEGDKFEFILDKVLPTLLKDETHKANFDKMFNGPEHGLMFIIEMDPTSRGGRHAGKYTEWILKGLGKSSFSRPMSDAAFWRVKENLALFEKNLHKLPPEEKDLYRLTLNDPFPFLTLEQTVERFKADVVYLLKGQQWNVFIPKNYIAAKIMGCDGWCTSRGESTYNSYNNSGDLIIIANKTKSLFQLYFKQKEFRDNNDNTVSLSDIWDLHDEIRPAIVKWASKGGSRGQTEAMRILSTPTETIAQWREQGRPLEKLPLLLKVKGLKSDLLKPQEVSSLEEIFSTGSFGRVVSVTFKIDRGTLIDKFECRWYNGKGDLDILTDGGYDSGDYQGYWDSNMIDDCLRLVDAEDLERRARSFAERENPEQKFRIWNELKEQYGDFKSMIRDCDESPFTQIQDAFRYAHEDMERDGYEVGLQKAAMRELRDRIPGKLEVKNWDDLWITVDLDEDVLTSGDADDDCSVMDYFEFLIEDEKPNWSTRWTKNDVDIWGNIDRNSFKEYFENHISYEIDL